jgi:hypothetical protein
MAGGIGMIGKVGFGIGEIYPLVSDVLAGILYGREASLEGTAVVADLPDAENVLDTDTVGGSPGLWASAPEEKVEKDYDYGVDGTGSTGTLEGGGKSAGYRSRY